MTRYVGRLRADARSRVAGDVATQIATRHGLPAGRIGGRRLAEGVPVILLAVGGFTRSSAWAGADNATEMTMPHATSSDIGFMAGFPSSRRCGLLIFR